MFSFHKPRVYRSAEGCCICRAKSSSSRFTDSRKYEQDSMKCFNLKYPRHGEICNACVLLVKRFKRLPVGSNRHWGHVVDARAGPGTKSISKHKKNRDDSENTSHNASSNNTSNSRRTQSSKSLISEKFTKIFKKSKKSKVVTGLTDDQKSDPTLGGFRNAVGLQTWPDQNVSVHDSMDSDYEDITDGSAIDGGGGATEVVRRTNTIVQFQTQTRASAYRASHKSATLSVGGTSGVANNNHAGRRKHPLKTGTKRRKFMPPIRNRSTLKLLNDNAQFYDELEWQERKSCCGKIYVSSSLVGTILLDMDNFKLCAEHQRTSKQQQQKQSIETQQQQQKTIIASVPAVVQISAPTAAAQPTAPYLPTTPAVVSAAAMNSNSTPVLKKHHLFFKRQSECFPQLDLCTNNISINNNSNKTDSSVAATNTPVIIKSNSNANNRSTIVTNTHQTTLSILSGINSTTNGTITNNICATLPLAINTTTSITAISSSISPSGNATGASAHHTMQLPRHSTAKVTTISPPLPTTTATNLSSNNRLLHKIRTGKIIKHSLEKIGVVPSISGTVSPTAIERIKTGDLPEVKPIMRAVPKSYVLTKPTTNGVGGVTNNQYPPTTQYYAPGSSPTSTCSNSSVISTASSSSAAPKFSDNSSDSGFDENLQDRKSASPLQEDTEKKLATRATTGNVHTMFLASGVQIQGQHQNLMLTGNEIAAKLLHNRKQQMSMLAAAAAASANSSGMHQHYQQQQTPNNCTGTRIGTATQSLKISQVTPTTISTIPIGGTTSGLGSHSKASTTTATITQSTRAIYNNNTIQHENGVTTIVPASSLAASSQTAAMNALAPSTVTITPAPSHHTASGGAAAQVASAAMSLTKKLTTGLGVNLITTGSNNQSNILHTVANNATHLINHNNNAALIQQHHKQQQHTQHQHHHHHHHNTTTNLNQKIILLKTTGPTKYNNTLGTNSNSSKMASTASSGMNVSTVNTNVCKN